MLTTAHDSSIRQVGTQRWLHKLNSQRQHRQHFSTLQAVSGLRAVSVGSSRAFAEALQHRLSCTAVQALLAAARGSTSSRPHLGCTQRIHMVGSFGVAYSALSARIKQVRVLPLRSGEARWPRRWHALQRRCVDGLIESVPTRACRMSETRLRVLKSVL